MTCSIPESHEPTSTVPPVETTRAREGATTLAELTTIGVGGKIGELVEARTEAEIIGAIEEADDAGRQLLVVGGGSNILASDDDFDGVVVRDMRREISTVDESFCGGGEMRVTAGAPWDEVVAYSIEQGWMGMEALSGIPGSTGAAPVQNIGAYGQEVSGVVTSVRVYDRLKKRPDTLFLTDLKLGYRSSILKESMAGEWGPSPRWIILDVSFQLRLATLSSPIRYAQLATKLGVEPGVRVPSSDVRAAVLELRASKGMVLDDADRDTYSLGSFFTNPVLTEEQAALLPEDAPRYSVTNSAAINQIGMAAPTVAGEVKTSAAWLIDHAGFKAGYAMPGPAALSTKHCLALTNRGGATGAQIADLAREVRDGVEEKFGVRLVPEPVVVGMTI